MQRYEFGIHNSQLHASLSRAICFSDAGGLTTPAEFPSLLLPTSVGRQTKNATKKRGAAKKVLLMPTPAVSGKGNLYCEPFYWATEKKTEAVRESPV